jgi:hypothetical protein
MRKFQIKKDLFFKYTEIQIQNWDRSGTLKNKLNELGNRENRNW